MSSKRVSVVQFRQFYKRQETYILTHTRYENISCMKFIDTFYPNRKIEIKNKQRFLLYCLLVSTSFIWFLVSLGNAEKISPVLYSKLKSQPNFNPSDRVVEQEQSLLHSLYCFYWTGVTFFDHIYIETKYGNHD